MIKIIKQGIPKKDEIIRFSCNRYDGCNSELEAKRSEFIIDSNFRETTYKIKCPVCKNWIYLNKI